MARNNAYLRPLLLQRSSWIEARVVQAAHAHGYPHLSPAMVRLFGSMARQPVGISELSRRMGVSRQAVHKLAKDAAEMGLVEFLPSTQDARVVQLRFTQAGWDMCAQAASDFEEIEAALASHLGARNLAELKRILSLPWDEDEQQAR